MLACALGSLTQLVRLDLSWNHMGAPGLAALAPGLVQVITLRRSRGSKGV